MANSKMAKKRPQNGKATFPKGHVSPDSGIATYFLSLSLNNVRCFGSSPQTLNLTNKNGVPARWTVLLGNNGTGKTTLLQMLAYFEPLSLEDVPDLHSTLNAPTSVKYIPRGRTRSDAKDCLRESATSLQVEVKIASARSLDQQADQYTHRECLWEINGSYRQWSLPMSEQEKWLHCYGYGASRRFSPSTMATPDQDDPVATLFSDEATLRNAEDWLLRLDYSASKPSEVREQQKKRLELVRNLLIEILPEVEDIRFSAPTSEQPTPSVQFKTPYVWVGLRQLGHGYRTLIAWMVDFASRLVDRNPDSPNPLATPAVALVDEIDLHLHPLWQRKLMSYLTECFPNTQFIVTAHSPLIVQAAGEDANIALLRQEGDHVVIENDIERIRGWRIDQLLTSDLFGLPSARPPQFDDLLKRREELLTKSTLTRTDQKELAELEDKIGFLPGGETAETAKAMALIDESIQLLKQQQDSTP